MYPAADMPSLGAFCPPVGPLFPSFLPSSSPLSIFLSPSSYALVSSFCIRSWSLLFSMKSPLFQGICFLIQWPHCHQLWCFPEQQQDWRLWILFPLGLGLVVGRRDRKRLGFVNLQLTHSLGFSSQWLLNGCHPGPQLHQGCTCTSIKCNQSPHDSHFNPHSNCWLACPESP